MTNRNYFFMFAVFFMVLVAATTATAEHRANSFMISPMIGHFGFDSDLDLNDHSAYGAGLGYNFTEHLGLEANYTEANNKPFNWNDSSVDGEVSFLRLDSLYHFITGNKNLVPYLAAGVGLLEYEGGRGDRTNKEFATNVGGGIKYFVHDNVALRADVRHVQTYPECSWLGTLGVTFYVGGCGGDKKTGPVDEAAGQSQMTGESMEQEALRRAREAFEHEDVYFDFDQSSLTADARSVLERKAAWLTSNPSASVNIEGHCDERGTVEYNIALGERRARSAMDFLVDLGTNASRLSTISYGEEKPVDPGHDEAAWSKNRRAHFVLR